VCEWSTLDTGSRVASWSERRHRLRRSHPERARELWGHFETSSRAVFAQLWKSVAVDPSALAGTAYDTPLGCGGARSCGRADWFLPAAGPVEKPEQQVRQSDSFRCHRWVIVGDGSMTSVACLK